jgi:dienelactone hydrolase
MRRISWFAGFLHSGVAACLISSAASAASATEYLDVENPLLPGGVPVLAPLADFPEPNTSPDADTQGVVYFESRTPFDFDVILEGRAAMLPTTGTATLFLPEGASAQHPVPGMVLLHGSGGISPGREMEYGEFLSQNGVAALVVNYFTPRGVSQETAYLVRIITVTELDAVADAYAGLAFMNKHPAIDGTRIGTMGFSYGGMAARIAMDKRVQTILADNDQKFALYLDYYGPCEFELGTKEVVGGPLVTLRGGLDASNDIQACRATEADLMALGATVQTHFFPDAGHAWEALTERKEYPSPYFHGCPMVFDEQGRTSVNGNYITAPLGADRATRYEWRAGLNVAMQDCTGIGYVIGRDEATLEKSNAILLDAVERYLK